MIGIAVAIYLLLGFAWSAWVSELVRRDQGEVPHWFLQLAFCLLWPVTIVWSVRVMLREAKRQREDIEFTSEKLREVNADLSEMIGNVRDHTCNPEHN